MGRLVKRTILLNNEFSMQLSGRILDFPPCGTTLRGLMPFDRRARYVRAQILASHRADQAIHKSRTPNPRPKTPNPMFFAGLHSRLHLGALILLTACINSTVMPFEWASTGIEADAWNRTSSLSLPLPKAVTLR